jgi:hypothetical protein
MPWRRSHHYWSDGQTIKRKCQASQYVNFEYSRSCACVDCYNEVIERDVGRKCRFSWSGSAERITTRTYLLQAHWRPGTKLGIQKLLISICSHMLLQHMYWYHVHIHKRPKAHGGDPRPKRSNRNAHKWKRMFVASCIYIPELIVWLVTNHNHDTWQAL